MQFYVQWISDNIQMNLTETSYGDLNWTQLANVAYRKHSTELTGSVKAENLLTKWLTIN
jgi:hypothetical protein